MTASGITWVNALVFDVTRNYISNPLIIVK